MVHLAVELLDEIFSKIDTPQDLFRIALVCKLFSSLIIPRHIEYRDIGAHLTTPVVWAHLARRTDLAKNIRSIRNPHGLIRGTPVTLITEEDRALGMQNDDVIVGYMAKALNSMRHLKISSWNMPIEPPIIRALSGITTLEQLTSFSPDPRDLKHHQDMQDLELGWHLPKLKNLAVISYPNETRPDIQMCRLIRQSGMSIQRLCISEACLNHIALVVHLPSLRCLNLTHSLLLNYTYPPPNHVENIITFLARHSLITDLTWDRRTNISAFPRGILPNLRRLKAPSEFLLALEAAHDDGSKLEIESLTSRTQLKVLNGLRCLNHNTLREVKITTNDLLFSELRMLGQLFPSIHTLSVILRRPLRVPLTRALDEALDALGQFKNLEIFEDEWFYKIPNYAQGIQNETIRDAILRLAVACPKLRQMSSYIPKRWTDRQVAMVYIMRKPISNHPSCPHLDTLAQANGERIWYEVRHKDSTHVFYDSRVQMALSPLEPGAKDRQS